MPKRTLIAVLVLSLVATACSSDDESPIAAGDRGADTEVTEGGPTVGVTDDSIVITASLDLSGPLGEIYANMFKVGHETWANAVNEQGGIHGRKIVFKKVDNRGTADGAIAACKEATSNGSFLTISVGGLDAETDCLDEDGHVSAVGYTNQADPQWENARVMISGPRIVLRLAEYVAGPMGHSAARIGVIYADSFEMTPLKDGFLRGADAEGLDVVDVQKIAPGQATFTAELQRLKAAGAEVVVILTSIEVFGILRDAAAIEFQPVFTGAAWMADELSQAGADFMGSMQGMRHWATTDTDAYRAYAATVAKHGSGEPSSTTAILYGYDLVIGEALERAGRNLTKASFLAAFDEIQGFQTGPLPPMSWKSGQIVGSSGAFAVECCQPDGSWRGLGEPHDRY